LLSNAACKYSLKEHRAPRLYLRSVSYFFKSDRYIWTVPSSGMMPFSALNFPGLSNEGSGKQLRGGLSEVVRRQLYELGFEKEGSSRKAAA
jgi:hypothetical protein